MSRPLLDEDIRSSISRRFHPPFLGLAGQVRVTRDQVRSDRWLSQGAELTAAWKNTSAGFPAASGITLKLPAIPPSCPMLSSNRKEASATCGPSVDRGIDPGCRLMTLTKSLIHKPADHHLLTGIRAIMSPSRPIADGFHIDNCYEIRIVIENQACHLTW